MLPMNVECKTQNLFQKEKKSLLELFNCTVQQALCTFLHNVKCRAFTSIRREVTFIWTHIYLPIPAHINSLLLTTAHIYLHQDDPTQTNIFSYLRNSAHLHEATFIQNLDPYIPADICSYQLIYMLTSTHICSHQIISAHHFSYLLRSSCSNFLISTNIFSHLLTSGHIGSDFQLLAITHTRSYQLTFTHF